MGHSPKRKTTKREPVQATKQQSHHFPVDRENLSHLLTSINWWSSQKEKNRIQGNQQANRVS